MTAPEPCDSVETPVRPVRRTMSASNQEVDMNETGPLLVTNEAGAPTVLPGPSVPATPSAPVATVAVTAAEVGRPETRRLMRSEAESKLRSGGLRALRT